MLAATVYELMQSRFPACMSHCARPILQEIFGRILDRQLTWPEDEDVSAECKDLVDGLLQLDPCERLGHRGAGEIKLHPWFQGLDWTSLARTKAAFIPSVENETDTSYFFDKPVCKPVHANLGLPNAIRLIC